VSQISHQPVAPTNAEIHAGGDTIAAHRHDEHQLIYVSTGVLAIHTQAGAWVASPDRAVWVPAGIWHEHRFYGRSAFHTVGFPADHPPLPTDTPTIVAADSLVRELMIACTQPGLAAGPAHRLRAVLHDRLPTAQLQPLQLPAPQDDRLADACQLVTDHLAQPRSLRQLADQVGCSERTLARLFRAEYGTTYPQWRTNVRIFHAMIYLAEGATVTQTGHRCGWATTSAFIDTFNRIMGQTPGAYRDAAKSKR
jgi:AraC-like DNA-binding protein